MKKLFPHEAQQKATQFLNCRRIEDLSSIGIDPNQLVLNALRPRYSTFEMRKKSGGFRTIEAPHPELKELQRQLNVFLQCIYYKRQSPAAYGYIIRLRDQAPRKNILENARAHQGAQYMLNVDFAGFFHQISDQRVFQLLQNPPFEFDKKTAHLLVKIFTYQKRLPMGAPTSPVLSNIAALDLDRALLDWAKARDIVYTRFVDDLTFSSTTTDMGHEDLEAIRNICAAHQLQLNPAKTKYFGPEDTKKVTGLVLNETIDIERGFYKRLDRDIKRLKHTAEVNLIVNKHQEHPLLKAFKQQIDGQINFIGMIEGYYSPEFLKYRKKLNKALHPEEETLSFRWTNFNYC